MQQVTFQATLNGRGFSVGRVQFDNAAEFGPHVHESAQLVLVYAGTWVDRTQRALELNAGELLFHPAGTRHENHSTAGCELIVVELSRDFVTTFCPLYGGTPRSLHFGFQAFDDIPQRLYDEVHRTDAPASLVVEALLIQLMATGARTMLTGNRQPEWLSRVTSHIHLHAHQPLTVSNLAEIGAVSLSRLSRGFREHTGKSITAYIREYRLRIAARALRQTHRSIKDIALNYGFYDHAHFSREFVKMHGLPPIEYRRRSRLPAEI